MPKKLEALKRFIHKMGDTQADLAKALGMGRTTLCLKLNETGARALTIRDMEAISEHYNIPLDQREALFFEKR